MQLTHETHGPLELVNLPQQLVMANADDTRKALQNIVDEGRHNLVLDLGSVDFVDSSGLSVLISALKAARAHEGSVVLLNPSETTRSLIELTRLHQVFDIYQDRQAALSWLD